MLIQFDQLQENIIPQFRGGEGNTVNRMYADPNNKIMRGLLAPGCTIGLHTHDTSSEIIYILSGKGKVLCDGEYEPLEAGSCHYCPKGHAHRRRAIWNFSRSSRSTAHENRFLYPGL